MSDYSDIQPELDDFENAVYGEEVRDSMVSAIKKIHDVAERAAGAPDASTATAGQAPIADGAGGWAWGDGYSPSVSLSETASGVSITVTNKNGSQTATVENGTATDAQVDAWLDRHPEATTTVQDGSLTESKLSNALKLKIIKDYVTPEMFGAVGDGVTDDTQAWKRAIASGKVIHANNSYLVTELLELDNDVYMDGVLFNDVSTGIKISNKTRHKYVLNVQAKQQTASEYTGVEIVNCNNCSFGLRVKNFYSGIVVNSDANGCAYNAFNSVFVSNSKYHIKLVASNNGWTNENYFCNVRCLNETGSLYKGNEYSVSFDVDNSNHNLNANSFTDCCFEGTYCAVDFKNAQNNSFKNIRTDGCTYACISDTESRYNIVEVSYGTIIAELNNATNTVKVKGYDFKKELSFLVATTGNLANRCTDNGTFSCADGLYNILYKNGERLNRPYIVNMLANEKGLSINGNSTVGKLINVEKNKKLLLKANVLNGTYRWIVVPFDENDGFISNADIRTDVSAFTELSNNAVGNYYSLQSNTGSSTILIYVRTQSVKKIYVGILGGTSWTGRIINNFEVYGTADNYEEYSNPVAQLSSIPTSQGFYPGQTVYSIDGTKKWIWNGTQWVENNIVLTT